jgi:endoglycosylceramidase
MRLRLLLCLAGLAPFLGGCGDSGSSGAQPTLEPLAIRADADWIRDDAGRVVLLRGANYSGLEFGNFIANPDGPRESDFAQLASWGVNVIRLPIAWSYLEPQPNQFDEGYLANQVDPVIAFAEAHGIRVVVDMHFYFWSSCIGGLGAPAWICDGHNYPAGEGGLLAATCDFFRNEGGARPPARAADGRLLRDHFLDAWRIVVRHYADDPRVIGWDYFNEPYGICFGFSGGAFEREALHSHYRRMRAIVAEENAERTFFYEPHVTRNIGLPAAVEPFGPDVVYAPHLYGSGGGSANQVYDGDIEALRAEYDSAEAEAAVLGGPLVVGEYGGNADGGPGFLEATELFLRDTYAELDRRLAGGTVWAYFPGGNGFSVVNADGSEKGRLVDMIARPYARRIAGIPTAMSFDVETKEFSLAFRDDEEGRPPDPTEIFVPAARHYPGGFEVEVSAGDSYELDETGTRILHFRGRSAEHHVRITRR